MMRPDHNSHEDHRPPGRRPLERSPAAEHAPGHEAALRTVLEPDHGDAEHALRIVTGCSQCSEELQKLTELRGWLDEAGANQRAVIGRARRAMESGQSAPGVELVAPFVRERLAQLQPRRSRLRRLAPLAAAAAALLVMLGWLVRSWFPRDQASGDGVLLGDHSTDGLDPSGEVSEYAAFRWPKLLLPPGGSYSLRVWDAIEDDPERALFSRDSLKENECRIEPATLATWPEHIGWEVQARDATNFDVGAPRRAYAKRVAR